MRSCWRASRSIRTARFTSTTSRPISRAPSRSASTASILRPRTLCGRNWSAWRCSKTMDLSATSLQVHEARVCYGARCVLDGVSLSAAGGEFIALLGASGCGKTTLLRTICGFVPVAGGSIAVGGRDITGLPPEKRNIAMVFQSYALWPHMTVAQNIGYGLKLRGVGRAEIARRIAELLAMLRLEGLG